MLEGWEVAEATKQKAAQFNRKCDWCGKRTVTHFVVRNKQYPLLMVCDHCYRKKKVKGAGEPTILKKPYRWAVSRKKKRAVFRSK